MSLDIAMIDISEMLIQISYIPESDYVIYSLLSNMKGIEY